METINERFKKLRKECHKTQDEFAEIFGMTRSGICDIEKGRNNVTEKHLIMLSNWHERKINIEWLRTGEGGPDCMFLHPEENDLIAQATALLGEKDQLFETLVVAYSKLTPDNKQVLLDFFKEFSDTLSKNSKEENRSNMTAATPNPRPDIALDPRDADTLSVAVREAEESYIKNRSGSAKRKASSVSNITDDEDKDAVNR